MSNPLINLLQVEIAREGVPLGYRPKSTFPYTDLTTPGTTEVQSNISDHATYVAGYWQDHGGAAFVDNWYLCELSNFDLGLKSPNRVPNLAALASVDLVIIPGAQNWESVSNFGIQLLQPWAEKLNALVLKSPPDAGQPFYQFPSQAVGENILTVGSSTTGSDMVNQPPIDLYFPVGYNSYVQPAMLPAGMFAIWDWLKRNAIKYRANDIVAILKQTALKDASGRVMFNASGALAEVKANYGATVAVPPPPPPPVTVIPPPVATPTPTPPSDLVPAAILSFSSNAAWAPVTFNWSATGTKLMLTDPKGQTKDVTGMTSLTASTSYSPPNYGVPYFTLHAIGSDGAEVIKTIVAHGCL